MHIVYVVCVVGCVEEQDESVVFQVLSSTPHPPRPSGNLSTSCSVALFNNIISHLLNGLHKGMASGPEAFSLTNARTFIQALTAITRQSGPRLSSYLHEIVPVVMHYTRDDREDELRESCLQAYEALVSRCYKEITPFIPKVGGWVCMWGPLLFAVCALLCCIHACVPWPVCVVLWVPIVAFARECSLCVYVTCVSLWNSDTFSSLLGLSMCTVITINVRMLYVFPSFLFKL